jgi:hypothetical protein
MPCCEAVSLPLRGLKSCLGGIVHPGAGLRTGSSKKSVIPSVGIGRRRIRDPVLPPLPQRCPPRGHRARGRRSFGMDAGAEGREQRQYIRCHRRGLSPGLFVVGFAHCMYSRTLHGPVYQTPGPLRTVRESLLPLSALPSMRLNRLCCPHSPCPIAPPALPAADAALLPVRGGRRERACGCSVSQQPCWQEWQRIPGWWREGLAFLPAEQGPSEIAVQGIKGSAGLPLWQNAAVIRAAEVSRRGLCCQAFSCSCRSPFAFCPLLCLCGLCWRSVLHPCLDLSADLHVPAANCLAYAPPFPSVRMQRTAQRV